MNKHMQRLALAGLAVGLVTLALAAAWGPGALADERTGGAPAAPAAPARAGVTAIFPPTAVLAPGLRTGQYRACVHNNDDDSQTVYYKTDINKLYEASFTVAAGGDACSPYTMTLAGARTIHISWTDPDNAETYALSQSTTVPEGGTVTANFIISRNPLYNVRVTNNDDDSQTVSYKLDVETSYHSMTVPAGAIVTSADWPGTTGSHTTTIKWTDPDTGQELTQTSGSQTLYLGATTTFVFTVLRNPLWNVSVRNNDDDELLFQYKLNSETAYHSLSIPVGATVTSADWPGSVGAHWLHCMWFDPDVGTSYCGAGPSQDLSLGTTTSFGLNVLGRNPLWFVSIGNGDDDDLTVSYKLDSEASFHTMAALAGSYVTSVNWPGSYADHTVTIKWTDPDLGTETSLTSVSKHLYVGNVTPFYFTIPRYSLHTIAVSADPPAGGTPSGGDTYSYGTQATVHANPGGGYTFVNWTEGAAVVSTSADYAFTVSADRTLVAHYQQMTATPTRTRTPAGATSTRTPTATGTATATLTPFSTPTGGWPVRLSLPVILSLF